MRRKWLIRKWWLWMIASYLGTAIYHLKQVLWRRRRKMGEKRKEYGVWEIITCPKCGGEDIDYDDAPEHAICFNCEIEFTLKTIAVWEE